ncbi:MAG: glycosyltransferase family 4 protein [Bacteroidales bacterium]|nr:glycosyltransferase family 4 protein [Bacteroidales bacterium]
MRRVLIITYYWPPSGGSGVQRWLKMSKYLPENGWQPVIYTAEGAEYPVEDLSLEKDVAPEAEIVRYPIIEPYSFYKKFLGIKKDEKIKAGFINEGKKKSVWKENVSVWLRGNLFIPDARCWWIRPSVRFLKKYLEKNSVDAIISTGPPHSLHLIAKKLHKRFNIPWIADFRDPWTDIDFFSELKLTNRSLKKHHRLQHQVLTEANKVVTVGWDWAKGLESHGAKDVAVITNGYDFSIDEKSEEIELSKEFTMSHVGIVGAARNAVVFWEALGELIKDNSLDGFSKLLKIKLIGQVDNSVVESIKKNNLESNVDIIPYIPHEKVIKEQCSSQVLLLFVNNSPNAKGILTGKIFEYMASGRPILAIGPKDGDTAIILDKTQTGVIVDFYDKEEMKKTIIDLFNKFKENQLVTKKNESVEKYSRRALAKEYAQLIENIVETRQLYK